MRFGITRKLEIDAAHRVPDHGSKCRHVHGHRYVIEASCDGPIFGQGEQNGMVLDFGFLKEEMVKAIHDPCDHAMIAWKDDPLLPILRECCGKLHIVPYVPTAECLARYWFQNLRRPVQQRSGNSARLVRVRVWETPNCWADYPVMPPRDFKTPDEVRAEYESPTERDFA